MHLMSSISLCVCVCTCTHKRACVYAGPFPPCARASGESARKVASQGGWNSNFANAGDPQVQPALQKFQANLLDVLALLTGWRGENT